MAENLKTVVVLYSSPGFRIDDGSYRPLPIDERQRIVSPLLELALIRWHGVFGDVETTWLRWATLAGEILPTPAEAAQRQAQREHRKAELERQRAQQEQQRAQQEQQRAQQERQRANEAEQRAQSAEAEVDRLRALLQQGRTPE